MMECIIKHKAEECVVLGKRSIVLVLRGWVRDSVCSVEQKITEVW